MSPVNSYQSCLEIRFMPTIVNFSILVIIQNLLSNISFSGSGPRGNHGNDSVFDSYSGVYSYKPGTLYCVSESTNTAHATFNWHTNTKYAQTATSELLMLAMPHHVSDLCWMFYEQSWLPLKIVVLWRIASYNPTFIPLQTGPHPEHRKCLVWFPVKRECLLAFGEHDLFDIYWSMW